MKSIKMALVMALFAVINVCTLEKPATPQNDPEILQIQTTLQELGREHLINQKYMGATATTTIQNQIAELKEKIKNVLTPEQRAQINAKIEQLKANLKTFKKSIAPAA